MKKILVLFSLITAGQLFGETRYSYCIAEQNGFRFCTRPELKLGTTEAKCKIFADDLGSRGFRIQSGTDLATLEVEMSAHCDNIVGPDEGAIYSCSYIRLCTQSNSKLYPLASRVYANTRADAIDRCVGENISKVTEKLKQASISNCYFKMVVDPVN